MIPRPYLYKNRIIFYLQTQLEYVVTICTIIIVKITAAI